MLKNNKNKIYNINNFTKKDEENKEKDIELKTIHIDKIDENSFIPIVLQKDI